MRRMPIVILAALTLSCTSEPASDFPVLSGTYLGQTAPADSARLFAPAIVSTGLPEYAVTVSPDGDEIFWTVFVKGPESIITTRLEDGRWIEPEIAPFSSRFNDGWPSFHPDGSKLYFHSYRALDGSDTKDSVVSIWHVEREGQGWRDPQPVPAPVNGNGFVCCASATNDGTLYYSKKIENGEIIYRSRFVDGQYETPEPLPEIVNAGRFQIHAVIAPDESYLVIPLFGRDDTINDRVNYYVFFRDPDDTWTGPFNLGEAVNDRETGGTPSISADGRYLFFEANSERDYFSEYDSIKTYAELRDIAVSLPSHRSGDVYWIGTEIIESLRPR